MNTDWDWVLLKRGRVILLSEEQGRVILMRNFGLDEIHPKIVGTQAIIYDYIQ